MQYAAPNIQQRWAELNAELEQIKTGLRIRRGQGIWIPPQRFESAEKGYPQYTTRALPVGYSPRLSRGVPQAVRDRIGGRVKDLLDTALQPGPLDDLSDDEVPSDFYRTRDLLEQSLPESFWEK